MIFHLILMYYASRRKLDGFLLPQLGYMLTYALNLNEMIPNDVKMDLHCLLVRRGKVCHRCAANGRPQFPLKMEVSLNVRWSASRVGLEKILYIS